jgi:flavin-dependent dehydrogenase
MIENQVKKNKDEIIILGAGPAGLSAAINLAKKGKKVKVYEKNNDCGMRFRGDFQGFENWTSEKDVLEEIKSMNLKIDFWYNPISQAEFYDYLRNKRVINFEKPGLYLIKRGKTPDSLDISLKNQALKSGVNIIFNQRISEKEADIIASGPKRVDGIVRGITFETKTEYNPVMILDDNLAPKSFAYLLINDGIGCLGTGLTKNYTQADKYLDTTIDTFQKLLNIDIKNPKRYTGYGNFFLKNSYYENKKFYVGEAAGLQDYLFAFGLRQALTSGYLAAISILENKNYDKLVKEILVPKLKISLTNRFFFRLLGNKGYHRFLKRGIKIKDPLGRMNKIYNVSLLQKALFPIARVALRK